MDFGALFTKAMAEADSPVKSTEPKPKKARAKAKSADAPKRRDPEPKTAGEIANAGKRWAPKIEDDTPLWVTDDAYAEPLSLKSVELLREAAAVTDANFKKWIENEATRYRKQITLVQIEPMTEEEIEAARLGITMLESHVVGTLRPELARAEIRVAKLETEHRKQRAARDAELKPYYGAMSLLAAELQQINDEIPEKEQTTETKEIKAQIKAKLTKLGEQMAEIEMRYVTAHASCKCQNAEKARGRAKRRIVRYALMVRSVKDRLASMAVVDWTREYRERTLVERRELPYALKEEIGGWHRELESWIRDDGTPIRGYRRVRIASLSRNSRWVVEWDDNGHTQLRQVGVTPDGVLMYGSESGRGKGDFSKLTGWRKDPARRERYLANERNAKAAKRETEARVKEAAEKHGAEFALLLNGKFRFRG